MRKHLVPTLLAAILVALPAAAEFDAAAFDKYVQQSMQAWRTPGVAVAIVQNGEVVHARGYGVREAGSPEPVDTRTLFGIGSCSKAFTTTALALLVEEGKLRWNDRVVDHLPWFQLYDAYVTSEFTISDLVTHRSGLATFSGDMLVFGSTYGREEIVRRARHLEPVAGFRSQFGYQNLMYVAAGLVLEELTRDSWDAFIDERIFTPLGMSDSNTSVTALARGGNVAMPHIEIEGEITPIEYWNVDNAAPAGSINSNVTDMARWIQVLLASGAIDDEHRLFSDASATRMWTVHTPRGQGGYGLGWALAHHEGSRRVSHDGGLPGMVVEVALLPDEQVGVVVLSNAMSGLPAALVGRVLDTYTAAEERDLSALMLEGFTRYEEAKRQAWIEREEQRTRQTSPSLPLADYAGDYEDKMYGPARVTLGDDGLALQLVPSPRFRGTLTHWHHNTFAIDWQEQMLPRGFVDFDLGIDGRIDEMTLDVPHFHDLLFSELTFRPVQD